MLRSPKLLFGSEAAASAGISSLLCMGLALGFRMGREPESRGMQQELASLEELPHTVPASALGLFIYVQTQPIL